MFDEEKQIVKTTTKQIVNACVNSPYFWAMLITYGIVFAGIFVFWDSSEYAPYIFRQLASIIFYAALISIFPVFIIFTFIGIARGEITSNDVYGSDDDEYMSEDPKEAILHNDAALFRAEHNPSINHPQPVQDTINRTKPTIIRRKGYVYVVNEINGDHYKIGRSGNPNNRVRTFGVKLPYRIDIDILIPTDDMYALESELHTKFADKRVDGEWFALTPEDIDWIRNEYETEEDKES